MKNNISQLWSSEKWEIRNGIVKFHPLQKNDFQTVHSYYQK